MGNKQMNFLKKYFLKANTIKFEKYFLIKYFSKKKTDFNIKLFFKLHMTTKVFGLRYFFNT